MSFREKYIETKDGLKIFTEAIGDAKNPAILLIMGAMNQGIFWYDSFCKKLALAGFFVIRYDHRDTGLSSAVNFLIHPYNLNDLTDDVVEILDGYSIGKAHIVGISMGGFIGQLLAVNHKERVQTLTLISTTADHRPYMDGVMGDFSNKYELPYPGKKFVEFVEKNKNNLPKKDEDFRNSQIEGWKIMFGDNFNQNDLEELEKLIDLSNTRNKNKLAPFNHGLAVSKSEPRLGLIEKISVPTLIIHGDEDICFPGEHSIFLNKHIPGSKLEEINDMGHMFAKSESEIVAEKIIEFCLGITHARVVVEHKGAYKVRNEHGEFLAKVTGKQIFNASSREDYPAVGDWVAITELNPEQAVIHKILPRKTIMKRKYNNKNEIQIIATNIDVAFVVESMDRDFNLNRFERYFAIANDGGIKSTIILNKIDLIPEEELQLKLSQIKNRWKDVDVILTSTLNEKGLDELKKYIEENKTYCFLGSSGVGKSSLINKLIGKEVIATNEISLYTDRGKHTTTRRQMYFLNNGGIVIDNPGMREVGMTDTGEGIDNLFDEITALGQECKFVDCTHIHEPGCKVLSALKSGELNKEKYSNFINLKKETEFYEMSELEKKEKDREFGKFIKTAKKQLKYRKN